MHPYERCTLCAHRCAADRTRGERGVCRMGQTLKLARAALHMWEEPPISGTRGSGTVFFSGCSLGCVYCQNKTISQDGFGVEVPDGRLAEIMLELQAAGAHNVNLVTPTHYVPTIRDAILAARARGLTVPIVYNTASYETVATLKMLDGLIDIFLPDFKYVDARIAARYSHASDYPIVARDAIDEMVRQCPRVELDADGVMRRGVIVRVLLLPGHVANAKLAVKYLHQTYGDRIGISLMDQYTPCAGLPHPLDRRATREEYRSLVRYAQKLGITEGFVQEEGCASESFIPPFDTTGVLKAPTGESGSLLRKDAE